ncbi:ATP-binding protein [Lelliottia sp. JS-SCA-14]|uniref:DEAD/DEAH box helicase n=1 Tax=Lelliottia sp. JS-SCA-14 TaxID=3110110 RepID=UPI002D771D6C|nr:ATP-binding protein [Lelliottia sp. JS-SCA-14]
MRQSALLQRGVQVVKEYMQIQHVFPFWKAIEALTPQKIDKDNPDDKLTPAYKIEFGGVMPWDNAKHARKPVSYGKVWRYTLQSGIYDLTSLSRLLEDKIGAHSEVFDDGRNGKSRLFDISFNEHGIPQFESFMLSLPVWSAGQILQQETGAFSLEHSIPADLSDLPAPGDIIPVIDSGFSDFDAITQHLMQWIANEAAHLQHEKLKADLPWIIRLAEIVIDKIKFPRVAMVTSLVCLAKCVQVNAPKPEQMDTAKTSSSDDKSPKIKRTTPAVAAADDLLNSFFIQELRHLGSAWKRKDVGIGFTEYMSAIAQPDRPRIDIRSPDGLKLAFQRLLPGQMPAGAWPSAYPLAFSQQLAVNEIWRRNADQAGIFAVNGPPGTGKTTLLRDVVAAVVTQRAKKLLKHTDDAFSVKKSIKIGDNWIPYFSLHSAIKGTSIVVASANNGAVENISLELPGEDAVPENVLGQSDYFADLVSELIGKPGWGLLAARLGNKSNRDEFLRVFWWRKPEENEEGDKTFPPDTFTPKRGEGLAYHLRLIRDGIRAPAIQWRDAVSHFQNVQAREESARKRLIEYSKLDEQISALRLRVKEMTDARALIFSRLTQARVELSEWDASVTQAQEAYREQRHQMDTAEHYLKQHELNKPGLLGWLSTLGRAHQEWWDRYNRLTQELDTVRAGIDPYQKALASTKAKQTDAFNAVARWELETQKADGSLDQANQRLDINVSLAEEAQSKMGHFWPDHSAPDDVREKSAPWAQEDWRNARESLFLAALDLHRSFIETHPGQILSNLNLVSDWLQGKNIPEKQAALALDSLSLIIPVISTTFASIPRMFKMIGREAIGWLLIDEAGQALPQQAAGAIWRAERTVVVGDPKQLEPVSGIPSIVEAALAQHHDVPASWWPSEISTQGLADQTMDLGTSLPDVDKGSVWVGSPLRVHRRCDDPMFTVSNRVAYDGLMVYGKMNVPTPLPPSCWIDVAGNQCEGNWIAEEGEAVKKLLLELRDFHNVLPENIFLISPFRDCARKLWRLAANLGLDTQKTGTVHTTQGKEASIVVFVLGGNVQNPGARAWAASRPNLLNVAVSRAKQRLYVIGSRSGWQKHRYFSTLAKNLPVSSPSNTSAQKTEDALS